MRVLAMVHAYIPTHNAGAEVMLSALLNPLAQRGHTVDVLLSEEDKDITEDYEIDGVSVFRHQHKSDPFRWLLGEHRPDVIVTHLHNTYRASILAHQYGIPVVHIQHNELDEGRRSSAFSEPDLQVYNTEWVKQEFEQWWPGTLPPSVVVHPPVSAEDYTTTPGDHVTLVNLCAKKGGEVFWQLAERFPQKRFLGVTGGYGEQVIKATENVTVLPHVAPSQMRTEVYGKTKVLLMPSVYESYGRAAAEAIHSGIPVIAHPTPGLRECLGDAGMFCDRDDIDAWEAALKKLLTPRGWSAASKRALKRAAQLDPTAELQLWCDTVERVARVGCISRSR